MASWMLEESNAMEAEAAGDDGLSNPSGSMLEEQAGSLHEEAVTLEGEAINELLRAQCLGKVMKGEAPSVQEAKLGLPDARQMMRWLSNSRNFLSIHDIDARMWGKAVSAAQLRKKTQHDDEHLPESEYLPEPEFDWEDRDCCADCDSFISYLEKIIKVGEDAEWVNAANNYPQLLSYYGMHALGYNLEATTDVLVAKRSAVRAHLPVKGAQVLFDIRKDIADDDLIRAEVRLVLANLHAPAEKPVVVVTDLCSEWHILWMDDTDICQSKFSTRAQAVMVIKGILAGSIEASQGCTQGAIVQRREIAGHMFASLG